MENQAENERVYTAALLIIGNEILSGRTQDKNAQHIALKLNEVGVTLTDIRVVPDQDARIISTIRELSHLYDYVFTTGGIGPTHDDITAECISRAFDAPLERNSQAYEVLLRHYGEAELTPVRARMAMIPRGAGLIPNPVSAAPGFRIGNVHVMAGVPRIMQAMMDHVLPTLKGGRPMLSETISVHVPESKMAEDLAALQNAHPAVEIGSYPFFQDGNLGVSMVLRSRDGSALKACYNDLLRRLEQRAIVLT